MIKYKRYFAYTSRDSSDRKELRKKYPFLNINSWVLILGEVLVLPFFAFDTREDTLEIYKKTLKNKVPEALSGILAYNTVERSLDFLIVVYK